MIDQIAKYAPMLRSRGIELYKAADYLEEWVSGRLAQTPLLRVDVRRGRSFSEARSQQRFGASF